MRSRSVLGVMLTAAAILAGCDAGATASPTATAIASAGGPTPAPSVATTPTPASTSTSGSPTTTGTLPVALAGTFAARIDPSVVADPDEAGDWFLTLTPSGGYAFGRVSTGSAENTGDLVIDGDHLTFQNERGLGACLPVGRYTWSIEGPQLTFQVVSDGCVVRVNQYVHQAFFRCIGAPATCAAVLP